MPARSALAKWCKRRPLERLIENGIPTETLVAHVAGRQICRSPRRSIVKRKSMPRPRHRARSLHPGGLGRPRRFSRCGRWHARLLEQLKQSTKLFADETTAPVLDPGRGAAFKKGQFVGLWRPTSGPGPAALRQALPTSMPPDRKHARPAEHLAGFSGILQVDGYGAYGGARSTR